MYMYIYIYMCNSQLYFSVYIYVYIHTYMYTYVPTYTHTCMNIYAYIHVYIYTYIYIYMNIYIQMTMPIFRTTAIFVARAALRCEKKKSVTKGHRNFLCRVIPSKYFFLLPCLSHTHTHTHTHPHPHPPTHTRKLPGLLFSVSKKAPAGFKSPVRVKTLTPEGQSLSWTFWKSQFLCIFSTGYLDLDWFWTYEYTGSAQQAGLKETEIIYEIDNQDVSGFDSEQVFL